MRPVPLTWRNREEEKDRTLILCPIVIDRTCSVVVERLWKTLLEVTERWGPVFGHAQTDASGREWSSLEMTGLDRGASSLGTVLRPVAT